MKTLQYLLLILLPLTILSCEEEDSGTLGGSQSAIGEVGNTFSVTGIPSGVAAPSIEVSDLEDGVSTLTVSANVTNPTLLSLLQSLDGYNGQNEKSAQFRATSKGIESVYDEGSFTLVKYNAKVGDTYTFKRGSMNLKREVTRVASEDDYYWGGMLIKTITVKETGRNIPGLSSTEMLFNHRFGIVGYVLNLEDGSRYSVGVQSANW